MKCVILAGGIGNTLWPLSRRNYPKQFLNICEGRSLLQDTIVRNLPFADEFIIVTNESYKEIMESQLKAFQGLRYRIIYMRVKTVVHLQVCTLENSLKNMVKR